METETDPSTPETADEQGSSQGQVRSYECTFCKRGFSNAQALGGHMNIHRKDKAKLKQTATTETQQQYINSLDIPKMAPSYTPISTYRPLQAPEMKASEVKISTINSWPWANLTAGKYDATVTDETHVRELRQLPLFAETPSINTEENQYGANTEKGLSSSHGLSRSELDLELRLGLEPQDSSEAAGIKKG